MDKVKIWVGKIKEIVLKPHSLIIIIIVSAIIGLIAWGLYLRFVEGRGWADWTGFGEYTETLEKDNRGKTLWDWLELLIIPIILGVGALWFNSQEKKREIESQERRAQVDREIAKDRQRENTLRDYFDKMADLLLKERLLEKKDKDKTLVDVAQVTTVTALRGLDTKRQNLLIFF